MKRETSPDENIEIRLPKSKVVIREAACPDGCNLMVPDMPIHGHASIGIRFSFDSVEDMIYLNPTYGSFENVCETPIPDGQVVSFHCPHCGVSLQDEEERCLTCS